MSKSEQTKGEKIQEKLGYKYKNAWLKMNHKEQEQTFAFCQSYIQFLNSVKTERESVEWAEREAIKNGFISLDEMVRKNQKLRPGDKVYAINRNKNIIFAVMGKKPIEEGINIIGAHIDSPRIDLKPNPLYEDGELVLLKTHYYGGIKKYQWVTTPLSLHGVIFKSNGDKVTLNIGENDDDPRFCICDLLPHLAQEQMQKKMVNGIDGEALTVLFGSIPYDEEELKHKIKTNILDLLQQKYDLEEEDFQRAEIELVPAIKACDVGLDRSMVGGYGQDDKVCAYTAFQAILEAQKVDKTALCIWIDKEEIGSEGNTGIKSPFFENTVAKLCSLSSDHYSDILLKDTLNHSKCLSADVTALFDPNYADVDDKRNTAYLGNGIAIMKYSGARGKADSSEANAEFVAEVTNLFNKNDVIWQSGELGKVDIGGGGTIAMHLTKYGMDVLDVGPGLLSMHSPFEICSKADVYMSYKAYKTFYKQ